jgi:putative ABC transport system permease protein
MRIGEITRVAVDAVVANKLRSLLTMLGVIIGIASVITMVALGNGAQKSVQDRLGALGTNVLTVRSGQSFQGGVDRGGNRLTVEDAEALAAAPKAIAAVAPEMESRLQVGVGAGNASLSVVGTWASYFGVNNHSLQAGRLFTDQENQGRRRVAVIGALVGERLGTGGSAALVGQEVQIGGVPFEVVGVLAEKGAAGFSNPDEGVYIPLATAQVRVMGSDRVRSIGVQAAGDGQMQAAMAEIDQVLRREHRIRPGQDADFDIRDQATLLSTFQETTKTFTFLLAGVAAVSLLVGGIGIMNIMLVSVTERTKEIGLRKSLGARKSDVLLQFLIEALVLCMGGGALGLAAGAGGSMALSKMAGWNMAVSPASLVLAFGFSAAVGVFFGIWPARRAASLVPIEALRYE